MTLDDIIANAADQDRGHEFELLDPVAGTPTGILLKIAGPDSDTQRRAKLATNDALLAWRDRPSAAEQEALAIEQLASCVLGWSIFEAGEPVPFNQKNLIRLLRVQWVRQQVDALASDRSPYFKGGA
jgi:hypothetical protein